MLKENPYIFTKGQYWFIEWYKNLEEAEQNAPDGYSVNRYTTTTQIPY